jgi:hypothetical protein
MTALSVSSSSKNQGKFGLEKSVSGDVTLLTMHGTLDQGFAGRATAAALTTRKVVVSMRDIRRFASWGMSEWMDFLRGSAERDLYLIECSTYAATQINLVTGLAGHAKLVSLYVPFRCTQCGNEADSLVLATRDREALRNLSTTTTVCAKCNGQASLEEHPASALVAIAELPPFDVEDDVAAFLRKEFGYDLPTDVTRLRARRKVREPYTYVRLSGALATVPGTLANTLQGTVVIDLAQASIDPDQSAAWSSFVQALALKGSSVQLMRCPVGFLDAGVTLDDLRNKLKIRTFQLDYVCHACQLIGPQTVDVADQLESLVQGLAPPFRCTSCRAPLLANISSSLDQRLRLLPAQPRDAELDAFLAKAQVEPSEKLDDALAPIRPTAAPKQRRWPYVAGLAALAAAVVLGVWIEKSSHSDEQAPVIVLPTINPTPAPVPPVFVRPDWILSDVPSSAYCHDLINRIMCVGVSSYHASRDEAVAEANDAALEEMVSAIGLKISQPFFKDQILPTYSTGRAKQLAVLQSADVDRTTPQYIAANAVVTQSRRRVVQLLEATGGAAAPTQRTDWYWEEYAKKDAKGTEQLAFVRYDITLDAVRSLVDKYSVITTVGDAQVMTVFPGLGWEYKVEGGAVVVKPGKALTAQGVSEMSIIQTAGDQKIIDGPTLGHHAKEAAKAVTFTRPDAKVSDSDAKTEAPKPQ